jgi:hypothetical protein
MDGHHRACRLNASHCLSIDAFSGKFCDSLPLLCTKCKGESGGSHPTCLFFAGGSVAHKQPIQPLLPIIMFRSVQLLRLFFCCARSACLKLLQVMCLFAFKIQNHLTSFRLRSMVAIAWDQQARLFSVTMHSLFILKPNLRHFASVIQNSEIDYDSLDTLGHLRWMMQK